MPRNIVSPGHCEEARDRTAFFYRAQELLRKEHNQMGEEFRKDKLSQEEWDTYLRKEFEPPSAQIVAGILAARRELKEDTSWDEYIPIA